MASWKFKYINSTTWTKNYLSFNVFAQLLNLPVLGNFCETGFTFLLSNQTNNQKNTRGAWRPDQATTPKGVKPGKALKCSIWQQAEVTTKIPVDVSGQ